MKITKSQLKQIISEEIEKVHQAPPRQEIEDLAAALSKSTAVQDAIAQLSRESKVISAAGSTLQDVSDNSIEEGDFAANVGAAATKAGVGAAGISALAATAPASSVFVTELMPLLANSPSLQALGIAGGTALAAVGILLLRKHAIENRTR